MSFKKLLGVFILIFLVVLLLAVTGIILSSKNSHKQIKENISPEDLAIWDQLPNEKIIFMSLETAKGAEYDSPG